LKIIIYTDGACSGNQHKTNKGGWGALLMQGDYHKEIFGGEINTTNQRMEIMACIQAMNTLKNDNFPIEIYSDSAYVVNCINQKWYANWERNGWKNAKKQAVENKDLWEALLQQTRKYNVTFYKVKGHSGDVYNEKADALAQRGIDSLK
jgi:ribonuclease HI